MSVEAYWNESGLGALVEAFDGARAVGGGATPLAAVMADLVRLHRLVRQHRRMVVLEFGVGYSTVVLAHALAANEAEFERLQPAGVVVGAHDFQVFSVDACAAWLNSVKRGLPDEIVDRTKLVHSTVRTGTFRDRLCHYYDALPDAVPDFIYLDGPDPRDVAGSINGLGFAGGRRVPMAADVLLMEPSLLPGAMILADGRTANARFLERHFYRTFRSNYDPDADVTCFVLDEPPLGRRNALRLAYQASQPTLAL